MRLIDEDALKAALVPLWNCHDDSDFANKDVWRELENAPTIDAVPVVRCEDCKCKDKYENFCRRFLREIDPSDFCSYGERKES